MENYYEVLKVRPTASVKEIRNAFKKLAIRYHPDKIRGDSEEVREEAHRMMSLINEAYRTLADSAKKEDYDVWLSARSRAKTPSGMGSPKGTPIPTPTTTPTPTRGLREEEWVGTGEWEKPEETQEREKRKREQILGNIESLILNRIEELKWQPAGIDGWERAYEGGGRLKKFRIAFKHLPEVTDADLSDLMESMGDAKKGLAGIFAPTTIFVLVFHEILNHAPIYEYFIDLNRNGTCHYLALVNLRFKRIDPPQVSIRDKVLERILACLWVNLE